MPELTNARRILTIDDNDAIHGDFRKILCPVTAGTKLADAKAALFGKKPAAATAADVRFEVESALQGEEGLKKLQESHAAGKPFSVAFVDMRMPPGWDGLQTIQRLWAVDADLQIIICSAFSDYSWEEISNAFGLTDKLLILKKPFDPAEVLQLATALSEKWSLRRAAKLKMDQLEQMVRERTDSLQHMVQHDKLTGLPNRWLITEKIAAAVEKAKVDPGYRYAVLFLDFDRFKIINDSLGHHAGDEVLKGIAGRLTAALKLAGPRAGDAVAARLGGDEFTILIDGTADTFDPDGFIERLLGILATPYRVVDRDAHCTASIGVTFSDQNYDNADAALRDADIAMYQAKAAGKARAVRFDRKMQEVASSKLDLENDLRQAGDRGELTLHYQPIYTIAGDRLKGFEALLRWVHPSRGDVPPLEFIPVFEEIGLMQKCGRWVLEHACRQLKQWTDRYPHAAGLTMNVNLSGKQLTAELPGVVAEVLVETGVVPSSVILELTETSAASGPTAPDVMRRLREGGVRIQLDDFGVGYSSLGTLQSLPVDGIKIDRGFMRNFTDHKEHRAIVQAMIGLAKQLDLTLIAEGVETPEHLAALRAMGCDAAQGYMLGRPVDAAAAGRLIAAGAPKLPMAA